MNSSSAGNWEGHVVLVTGAAQGIGLAVVTAFASQGARVVGWDRPGSDWSAAAAATHGQGAAGWLAIEGDVSLASDWQRAIERARHQFGRLDGVVNNAGIGGPLTPLVEYDDDAFDRVLAINLRGVYLGMKHGGRALMEQGGGSIVNLSSIAGIFGGALTVAYTASKHAVIGMTRVAAAEMGRHGVRVNSVCPSPTDTAMMAEVAHARTPDDPERTRRRMEEGNPMGRYATAAEIANAVLFLAGKEAGYINGTTLVVDGGQTVGRVR